MRGESSTTLRFLKLWFPNRLPEERARASDPFRKRNNNVFQGSNFRNCLFSRCHFTGARLDHSTFSNCTFVGCSFERAILNNSKWRNSHFLDCSFPHAEFTHATLRRCSAFRCDFSDCDIEYSRGFKFTYRRLKDLYSGNTPRDPWSILVRKCTYTNFALYLAGTLLLLAPHLLFIAAMIMFSRYQESVLTALHSAGVESPALGNTIVCGASLCRKTSVSAAALAGLGVGTGRVFTFLVIYNLARFYVTDRVLRMKAQYDQSGVTANWRSGELNYRESTRLTLTTKGVSKNTKASTLFGKAWEEISEFMQSIRDWRILDVGYRWYYWFHVITRPLVFGAFVYSAVNLYSLINSALYLPSW